MREIFDKMRQNATEYVRVCYGVHQARVRVSQAEPWPTDCPMPVTDWPSRQILETDRPNLATDRPNTLLCTEIDILTRFGLFLVVFKYFKSN